MDLACGRRAYLAGAAVRPGVLEQLHGGQDDLRGPVLLATFRLVRADCQAAFYQDEHALLQIGVGRLSELFPGDDVDIIDRLVLLAAMIYRDRELGNRCTALNIAKVGIAHDVPDKNYTVEVCHDRSSFCARGAHVTMVRGSMHRRRPVPREPRASLQTGTVTS